MQLSSPSVSEMSSPMKRSGMDSQIMQSPFNNNNNIQDHHTSDDEVERNDKRHNKDDNIDDRIHKQIKLNH